MNPLEAESATAWSRFMRARLPLHKLPERYLAPCFVAFYGEQMDQECALPGFRELSVPAQSGASLRQLPDAPLSRWVETSEVTPRGKQGRVATRAGKGREGQNRHRTHREGKGKAGERCAVAAAAMEKAEGLWVKP